MRGIRIWHLAALALSLPLVAAAVPNGCTGGLNPNFRQAIGQGAGTGVTIPIGYLLLGIFDETGYPGYLDTTVTGKTWASGWRLGFDIDRPRGIAWACDLISLEIVGGAVLVPDPQTGVPAPTDITFTGGAANPLMGNRIGDPLECGTLVKVRVFPSGATTYAMDVELLK